MNKLRKQFTYANVMVTLLAFVVLGGGAYAALKLPKNSVGAKQLKKNSVTKAKIKKNAVTTAKLRNDAVDGSKVRDASLTGSDIDATTMPFSRVVAKARGSSQVSLPKVGFAVYPLGNATYTQAANEDDRFVAAVDVTFQPSCEGSREARAFLLLDTNPASPSELDQLGEGAAVGKGTGTDTERIEINATGTRFEPGTAKQHTLTLLVSEECGTGSGVTAIFGGVDVIGTSS